MVTVSIIIVAGIIIGNSDHIARRDDGAVRDASSYANRYAKNERVPSIQTETLPAETAFTAALLNADSPSVESVAFIRMRELIKSPGPTQHRIVPIIADGDCAARKSQTGTQKDAFVAASIRQYLRVPKTVTR